METASRAAAHDTTRKKQHRDGKQPQHKTKQSRGQGGSYVRSCQTILVCSGYSTTSIADEDAAAAVHCSTMSVGTLKNKQGCYKLCGAHTWWHIPAQELCRGVKEHEFI